MSKSILGISAPGTRVTVSGNLAHVIPSGDGLVAVVTLNSGGMVAVPYATLSILGDGGREES